MKCPAKQKDYLSVFDTVVVGGASVQQQCHVTLLLRPELQNGGGRGACYASDARTTSLYITVLKRACLLNS